VRKRATRSRKAIASRDGERQKPFEIGLEACFSKVARAMRQIHQKRRGNRGWNQHQQPTAKCPFAGELQDGAEQQENSSEPTEESCHRNASYNCGCCLFKWYMEGQFPVLVLSFQF
jgi:hypothetical protein